MRAFNAVIAADGSFQAQAGTPTFVAQSVVVIWRVTWLATLVAIISKQTGEAHGKSLVERDGGEGVPA